MSWFKKISQDIKDEILNNVKQNGKSVKDMSKEYNVATQTIYKWLKDDTEYNTNWQYSRSALLEINKLKNEKKELIEIVGKLTIIANRFKKKELIF